MLGITATTIMIVRLLICCRSTASGLFGGEGETNRWSKARPRTWCRNATLLKLGTLKILRLY